MKTIEVSDDVYLALQQLAEASQQSPETLLASLLCVPAGATTAESILAFVLGPGLRSSPNAGDAYLGVLSWIATRHGAEFGEFIRSEATSSRFLSVSREELLELCDRNLSCQINGTQYWAVMNIDDGMKRRFVARLLEFVGYRAAAIDLVTTAIGLGKTRRGRLASLVA